MFHSLEDRKISNAMKGAAMVLMLVHHFFTFPDWYVDGLAYPGIEVFARIFCSPTKICVGIFAFLTGYFLFYKKISMKYVVKKITDLLTAYWVFFVPFLLIAIYLGTYDFHLKNVLLEALAIRRDIMYFCWYVPFYCVTIAVLPVVVKLFRNSLLADAVVVLAVQVGCAAASKLVPDFYLSDLLAGISAWFPSTLLGYLTAKYDLFHKIENALIGKLPEYCMKICYVCMVLIPFMLRSGDIMLSFGEFFSIRFQILSMNSC